jgi:hypothetical protein
MAPGVAEWPHEQSATAAAEPGEPPREALNISLAAAISDLQNDLAVA